LCSVDIPNIPYNLLTPVRELYRRDFFPVFLQDDLPPVDQWYGPRPNGKRPRTPQFSTRFESRSTFKIFHPMITSLPLNYEHDLVAAAENECKNRTVSEWLVLNVFFTLPYGSIAEVAASNLKEACEYSKSLGNPLPFQTACRPLPKGATGSNRFTAGQGAARRRKCCNNTRNLDFVDQR
jgi:hypothetical protein